MTCDPILFPAKNSSNIAKINRIFPGKRRRDKALILTYLDSPMVEVFPHYWLSFSILAYLQGETECQSWTKTLGLSLFYENSKASKTFQTMFLFARVLPLVRISAILDYIWGIKGSKSFWKDHFVNVESVHKMILYLHEIVNRKALRARNLVFWLNF